MNQPSEEMLREILQYLWQMHVQNEQQYLYWILFAPLIGLLVFLILWTRHRAHCPTLIDALCFFFAPRGPEKVLIFKDLAGNRVMVYDYTVVKGKDGYLIQAGPYLIKSNVDPDEYSEPVSLLDCRGPAGVPSPFGLWIRQLICSYIIIGIIVVSFANTFWITSSVYVPAMGVSLTNIDLLSFAALVIGFSWIIATLLRSLSPQTMLATISAIGVSETAIEASAGLDVYSSFPPIKILKAINREPRINVNISFTTVSEEEKKEKMTFWDRLVEELGDKSLAASLLAMLGQVYDAWRKSVGIVLADRYDISVAARARYQLSEVKMPTPKLQKYAGLLALAAIILAIVLLVIWLQPTIQPATTNTTAIGPVSPAQPPTPPITSPTVSPASPPPPPTPTG